MRKGDGSSPETIRTVKLLKYLLSGRTVEVEGRPYYLKSVVKFGDGAVDAGSVSVDDWTLEEFKTLAESLTGKVYNDVMNFKVEGPGESK